MSGKRYHGRPCPHGHGTLRYSRNYACVVCQKLRCDRWKSANPGRVREVRRVWADKVNLPERERWQQIKKKYGLSLEQFNEMLAIQAGCCAICRDSFGEETPRVDHDHKTGMVRGLLCHPCNVAIGLFKESVPSLANAITYLSGKV